MGLNGTALRPVAGVRSIVRCGARSRHNRLERTKAVLLACRPSVVIIIVIEQRGPSSADHG